MAESQKEKLMRILGCTEAEAEDIIASDKAIDKGERVYFDLDPETEKQAKKLINVETHKKSTEKTYESVKIINKERQIAFKVGADSFELTLVQKRKPKN